MTERLKQIWSGFEGRTARRLTGGGVENIATPHRRDWRSEDAQFLPESYSAPAAAAFEALKTRLASHERKNGAKRGRGASEAPEAFAAEAHLSADEPAMAMIRGLKATEIRTERPRYDYGAFREADAKRRAGGGRKKFLGLF